MRHLTVFLLLAAFCLAASAVPAEAQIYAWRDESGNLVLSDRPRKGPTLVRTYAVQRATNVVTTRPPSGMYPSDYDSYIESNARKFGVRSDLVRAVIQVESGFNPRARSHKGAMGLMQLMPGTAAELGVKRPYHPAENIRGGVEYLRQLLDRYEGNEELALAAYNAGPTTVDRYGQQVPPYRETRAYVSRVSARASGLTNSPSGTSSSPPKPLVYYKVVEVIDGRRVPRYTDTKPSSGTYEIVKP